VDDQKWATSLGELADSAEMFAVLSRCLSVTPQLSIWRDKREAFSGTDAANALDQARGDLERLVAGGASALLQLVESVLGDLPTAWE
jgi:hypothetical protein